MNEYEGTRMIFDDNDLKRLKENLPYWGARTQEQPSLLEALIARLEAAEVALDVLYKSSDYRDWKEVDAWRKAAGK